MSWIVEDALEEVATAIECGAAPFEIDEATRDSLKNLFESDFDRQSRAGTRWREDKKRVLPLAQRIGRRAKLLTLDKLALSDSARDKGITSIRQETALRAAYYVCKTYQIASRKAGPYCTEVRMSEPVRDQEGLDQLLRTIRKSGHEL